MAAEVKALAQKRGAEAIRTLTQLMRSAEKDEVKVRAAEALLDRAYGRAPQALSVEVATAAPVISDSEWEALARLRHQVRQLRPAMPSLPAATPSAPDVPPQTTEPGEITEGPLPCGGIPASDGSGGTP